MPKPSLIISRIEFDVTAIASALKISEDQAINALRDVACPNEVVRFQS